MALVNELLDKLIVEEVGSRLKDGAAVVGEIEILEKRIKMNAHVLDSSVPKLSPGRQHRPGRGCDRGTQFRIQSGRGSSLANIGMRSLFQYSGIQAGP
jgi:hypothetical protein